MSSPGFLKEEYKIVAYGPEARSKLFEGIDAVVRAVKTTLGPKGRNAVYGSFNESPTITNDGVAIAYHINFREPLKQLGCQLIKEVGEKQNESSGDGTTTSMVLAGALIKEGMKHLVGGMDSMSLKRGFDYAYQFIVEELQKLKRPINGREDFKNIAVLSAEDEEVGELIAQVIEKVGEDGIITIQESQTFGVDIEVTQGIRLEQGFVSPYFITDQKTGEAVLKNPHILITDKEISTAEEVLPIMNKLRQEGFKDLLVIASAIDGEALATLVLNKLKGAFNSIAIKTPSLRTNLDASRPSYFN